MGKYFDTNQPIKWDKEEKFFKGSQAAGLHYNSNIGNNHGEAGSTDTANIVGNTGPTGSTGSTGTGLPPVTGTTGAQAGNTGPNSSTDEWWTAFQKTSDWGTATNQFKTLQEQGLVPTQYGTFGDVIAERKKHEKGSDAYDTVNMIINAAYGNQEAISIVRKNIAASTVSTGSTGPTGSTGSTGPTGSTGSKPPPERKSLKEWFKETEELEEAGIYDPSVKPVKAWKTDADEKWKDPVKMKDWVHPDEKDLNAIKQNYRKNIKTIINKQGVK